MQHPAREVSSSVKHAQRPLLTAGIRAVVAGLGLLAAVVLAAHWLASGDIEAMLPVDSGAESGAVAATLEGVALVYADGLAMVARRYAEGGLREEARSLLERVVLIRKRILPADHRDLAAAETSLRQVAGESATAPAAPPAPGGR